MVAAADATRLSLPASCQQSKAFLRAVNSPSRLAWGYLKKIQPFLEEKGVILEIGKGKQPYSVSEKAPPTTQTTADASPAASSTPVNVLRTTDQPDSEYRPTALT